MKARLKTGANPHTIFTPLMESLGLDLPRIDGNIIVLDQGGKNVQETSGVLDLPPISVLLGLRSTGFQG
jgi:hypothetical protein